MSNPGIAVVDCTYAVTKIGTEWSVRNKRGFTCWGKDFAQRVLAEPPFDEDGFLISRILARTDVISGFLAREENQTWLALFNRWLP